MNMKPSIWKTFLYSNVRDWKSYTENSHLMLKVVLQLNDEVYLIFHTPESCQIILLLYMKRISPIVLIKAYHHAPSSFQYCYFI